MKYGWDDIDRPEYCTCPVPWHTPTGPLKDGLHDSGCLAAEIAQDIAELRAIVLSVDACEPLVQYDDDMTGVWFQCGFCDAGTWGKTSAPFVKEPEGPVEHRSDCPWRRANEWVAAQSLRRHGPLAEG